VRDSGGRLMIGNLKRLFQTLTLCLADSDYHITLQALGLLADIAPDSRSDVGTFIPFLMVRHCPGGGAWLTFIFVAVLVLRKVQFIVYTHCVRPRDGMCSV
jgi:hypothetical protein